MSIAIFLVLALLAAGAIIYPLLPGRTPARLAPTVSDGEIDRAVRSLRRARSRLGLFCSTCGQGYQAGDRFCVRCGSTLTQVGGTSEGPACPSCGATLREDDRFCAKCGQELGAREVA